MKIKHLTLVFIIIFFSLICPVLIKDRVNRISRETKTKIKKAVQEGVMAAASVQRKKAEGVLFAGSSEMNELVLRELIKGVTASLGIGHIPDARARVAGLIPIVCICDESSFTLISTRLTADGRITAGESVPVTKDLDGEELSIDKANGAYIKTLEKALEAETGRVAALKKTRRNVTVDLPEFSYDASVLAITGPSVVAISFGEDALTGFYDIGLHGAGLSAKPAFYGINAASGKEVHAGDCKKLKEILDKGTPYEIYEEEKDAVIAGYKPVSCCDPLSCYYLDTYVFGDFPH